MSTRCRADDISPDMQSCGALVCMNCGLWPAPRRGWHGVLCDRASAPVELGVSAVVVEDALQFPTRGIGEHAFTDDDYGKAPSAVGEG